MQSIKSLEKNLKKGVIGSSILLANALLTDNSVKRTPAYSDSRHFPFYYHLGQKLCNRARVIQFGPSMGLPAICYLQGGTISGAWCIVGKHDKFVEGNTKRYINEKALVHFWSPDDFDPKFVWSDDGEFFYGLGLITEEFSYDECKSYLNFIWNNILPESLIVVDYIHGKGGNGKAFEEFCRVRNRKPVYFDTRYGIGIVQR